MKIINEISIAFYGTPQFSLKFLEHLFTKKVKISYIVSQPPKTSGRGRMIEMSAVHKWAKKKDITVFTPRSMDDHEFLKKVSKINVDLNIIVAYGNILTDKIINLPSYMSINVHASLLPRWRGAAPIQRAILAKDKEIGVSIIKVEKKLDAGPILLEKKIILGKEDNHGSVNEKIILEGKVLLERAIIKIVNNEINYKIQDENLVTYAHKINKSECKILWENDALSISQQIKAFSPYPGAWTIMKNSNLRIKILKAEIIKKKENEENKVFMIGDINKNFEVKCGKNFLKIEILQREGKKPTNAKDFLNGMKSNNLSFSK